jgi:hypothetical protein
MSRSLLTLFLLVFGLCSSFGAWAVPLAVSDPTALANSMPELRIMPLGASITEGIASSPRNGRSSFFSVGLVARTDSWVTSGYRRKLREQLRFDGYEVDMVCFEVGV